MSEETAAAPNVDPEVALTGEELDRALDISRAEAAANAAGETSTPAQSGQPSDGPERS